MDNEQVLITAAVAEDVPERLKAKMFHVNQGVVTEGVVPDGVVPEGGDQ